MPPAVTALIWLHVGAALVWACCSLVVILAPDRAAVARVGDACAALFAAAAMPFTGQGGWWVDMPADYIATALEITEEAAEAILLRAQNLVSNTEPADADT